MNTASRLFRAWFTPAPDSEALTNIRRGKSPWVDAVHLLWSAWVFITPAFGEHYSWGWVTLTLVSYPLFLLLYAKVFLVSRRTSKYYALALAALGLLLLPWYSSAVSYFIYGCVLLRDCRVSLRRYLLQLSLLNGCFLVVAASVGYPWQVLVMMPFMTFVIGTIITVERVNEEKDAALKLSHDEVRRLAATAERERIGRDLHDLLGHTLSLITLKLELSRKLFDRDTEAARREVEEAEKVARHALAEVRSAVTGIRATDLAAELASVRLLLESSSVHLDYRLPTLSLPVEIERGLSLIMREAATNIARHAEASQASMSVDVDNGRVQLQVTDNGRGGVSEDGNGLVGMRERVRALGGTLTIESPRGQGTTLQVQLPLPEMRSLNVSMNSRPENFPISPADDARSIA
ncbi:sensor histidine kinase [Dyella tabacisoli]|uniref:Sensor histidine kinase n=1 Tax=Dyella tabacisoli TaxID=2282381 RepID=A0A369USE4_9GAMM|nr:sensor histidine kinase [Dyella tabacisoli]RDD82550.1 sensor histidine kinase [Dyella tabacisoli]